VEAIRRYGDRVALTELLDFVLEAIALGIRSREASAHLVLEARIGLHARAALPLSTVAGCTSSRNGCAGR
jgi:hypothetical protein